MFNVKILTEWSTYLPLAERIINSTIHSELGYSPAMLGYMAIQLTLINISYILVKRI